MRVDDMYELDSPELGLESETCLRFYNYSGNINIAEKSLDGDAEGFATCTLNGSIGLTVDEKVEGMKKVALERVSSPTSLDLEVNNLEFFTGNFPSNVTKSDTKLSVREFSGYITLYPPDGVSMDGTGVVEVGDRKIVNN